MGRFSSSKQFKLGDVVQAALKPSLTLLKTSTDCNAAAKASGGALPYFSTAVDDKVESSREDFIEALGIVLARRVEQARTRGKNAGISRFHASQVPAVDICEYLKRLRKYFACSDECFVIALVYIDRISKADSCVTVCDLTVHRLLLIALIIAAKFQDDIYYKNMYYAKLGGISLKEINMLEALFLKMLDWKTFVPREEYELYNRLVNQSVYQLHERISL